MELATRSIAPNPGAMTANAMNGVREKYLNAGMDDYISKPFKLQDLEEAIIKWGSQIQARKVK